MFFPLDRSNWFVCYIYTAAECFSCGFLPAHNGTQGLCIIVIKKGFKDYM